MHARAGFRDCRAHYRTAMVDVGNNTIPSSTSRPCSDQRKCEEKLDDGLKTSVLMCDQGGDTRVF